MSPLHVIGDRDTVLAFALGGIPGDVVETPREARHAVEAVAMPEPDGAQGSQPTLLLITQETARGIRDVLDRLLVDQDAPLVLEIPGFAEPAGESEAGSFVKRILGGRR
jgi:vacuolar-type H+-ATPase subunit F/Vma7